MCLNNRFFKYSRLLMDILELLIIIFQASFLNKTLLDAIPTDENTKITLILFK